MDYSYGTQDSRVDAWMLSHEHETKLKAVLKGIAASHSQDPVHKVHKMLPLFLPLLDGKTLTVASFKATTFIFVGDREELLTRLESLSIPRPATSKKTAVKALTSRIIKFLKAVHANNVNISNQRNTNKMMAEKGQDLLTYTHDTMVDVPVFPDVPGLKRAALEMMGIKNSYYFRRDVVTELQGYLVREECDDATIRAAWGMIMAAEIMEG